MHKTLTENGNVMDVVCECLQDYVGYAESLVGNGNFMFRGQNNSEYRLQDSWRRYSFTPHEEWMTDFSEMLNSFIIGCKANRLNEIQLSLDSPVIEKLQVGRHWGLPTPCLDFTYSPYVALFFAFNGISHSEYRDFYDKTKTAKSSVIYAIDKSKLADIWARYCNRAPFAKKPEDDRYLDYYKEFLTEDGDFFQNDDEEELFPSQCLKLIPYGCHYNNRMWKQLGALLYDTLDYSRMPYEDLEDFIRKAEMTSCIDETENTPAMYKFIISHRFVSDVFAKLELMNINGSSLYGGVEGIVEDCMNRYFYNSVYHISAKR